MRLFRLFIREVPFWLFSYSLNNLHFRQVLLNNDKRSTKFKAQKTFLTYDEFILDPLLCLQFEISQHFLSYISKDLFTVGDLYHLWKALLSNFVFRLKLAVSLQLKCQVDIC